MVLDVSSRLSHSKPTFYTVAFQGHPGNLSPAAKRCRSTTYEHSRDEYLGTRGDWGFFPPVILW